MGPFCSEQGNSSQETIKELEVASTDEKTMFSGEEVGSEKKKNQNGVIKFTLHLRRCLFIKQFYKLLIILY